MLVGGCASTGEVRDPIEPFNRAMFTFNECVDRYFMRPGAKAYSAVTPRPIQRSVSNFFRNVRAVNSAASSFLQGKGKKGAVEVGRIVVNTTFGIGGLIDVGRMVGLEPANEESPEFAPSPLLALDEPAEGLEVSEAPD